MHLIQAIPHVVSVCEFNDAHEPVSLACPHVREHHFARFSHEVFQVLPGAPVRQVHDLDAQVHVPWTRLASVPTASTTTATPSVSSASTSSYLNLAHKDEKKKRNVEEEEEKV